MVRAIAIFCVAVISVAAQEVTPLGGYAGTIIRDAQANWFIADTVDHTDLRVRKLTPDLSANQWSRIIQGAGTEDSRTLLAHSDGGLLILGNTSSRGLPVTPGVLASTPAPGPSSPFLVRLNDVGEVVFSTWLHDGTSIRAENLLRQQGDEIVLALTGRLWRIDAQATRRTSEVLSPWIGGPMQLDDRGNLWVTGSTQSDQLPVSAGAFQTTRQSGICSSFVGPFNCPTGFVMRLNASTGAVEAATYLGGQSRAFMTSIDVGTDGTPIVVGNVQGGLFEGDFPTTPGSFQPRVFARDFSPWFVARSVTYNTPVVVRLTPDLDKLVYATYLAGARAEIATWVSVDQFGRAVVTGDTVSHDFPGTGAFARPCGPDFGPSAPSRSFVARLSADGTSLDSSAILFGSSIGVPFYDQDDSVVMSTDSGGLVRVALDSTATVACIINGASYRTEGFVTPGQLLTLIGAGIPSGARLLFDGIPAKLLYLSPDQINVVVPPEIRGRQSTEMALEVDGLHYNLQTFDVLETNPTVKLFVRPDGKLEDRGMPLADVRLENGTQNGTANPARRGEVIEVYSTGLDVARPVEIRMGDSAAELLEVMLLEGAGGAVQKLRVRIPEVPHAGVVNIVIQNGGRTTPNTGGFVWVE